MPSIEIKGGWGRGDGIEEKDNEFHFVHIEFEISMEYLVGH